jgi:hypothetical protein
VYDREVVDEALTGEASRPAIEPRNPSFGMATLLGEAEGNMRVGNEVATIASYVLIPRGHRT